MAMYKIVSLGVNIRKEGSLFVGRDADPYLRMFDLKLETLKAEGASVLDVCGGFGSLTAVLSEEGLKGVSVDFQYLRSDNKDISRSDHARALADTGWKAIEKVHKEKFSEEYKPKLIKAALEKFRQHYADHPESYQYADVRKPLSFKDNSFSIGLNGNSLFTKISVFKLPDIMAIVSELVRVSKQEVRIYAIISRKRAEENPNGFECALFKDLEAAGLKVELRKSPHDSRKCKHNRDSILIIKKPKNYDMKRLVFSRSEKVDPKTYFG